MTPSARAILCANFWSLEPLAVQKQAILIARKRIEDLLAEGKTAEDNALAFFLKLEDQMTANVTRLKELVQ